MSTTLHVGKSKTVTVKNVPAGYTFGWMCSADGGNVVLNGQQESCTVQCVGVTQKGDYVPGQPVKLVCQITGKTPDDVTNVETAVYLVAANTPEVPVPLNGTQIMVVADWGKET